MTDLSVALWPQIITFDSGIITSQRIGECNPTTRNVGHCDNEELYDSFRSQDHIMTLRWAVQSCPKALFQSEAKCNAITMKRICYSHEKETHFYKKGFALSLVSKVRVFATQKWPTPSAEGLIILVQRTTRIKMIVNSILNILWLRKQVETNKRRKSSQQDHGKITRNNCFLYGSHFTRVGQ